MADSSYSPVLNEYARALIQTKARQLIRRPGFGRSDAADLVQEMTLHLLSQAHHFDPARASVNTYIARVVDSSVAMILRAHRRQKRAAERRAISIEAATVEAEGRSRSLGETLSGDDLLRRTGATPQDEAAALAQDVRQALAGLPPDLLEVCLRLLEGSPASAARDLGISRRQVRNAIARIRRHFEDTGLGSLCDPPTCHGRTPSG